MCAIYAEQMLWERAINTAAEGFFAIQNLDFTNLENQPFSLKAFNKILMKKNYKKSFHFWPIVVH